LDSRSTTDTSLFRMGPITAPLFPSTQSDVLGILQREQDHALSLLSLSPLLSSLFISYANRAAALELASAVPSPESEEWKTLQTTVNTLREENEKLKLETRETAEKLEAAEASQEAFRSQVSSLKEVNATQQDDVKSLWAELFEAGDRYDRLVEDSNAEKSALQAQVLDLKTQQQELKETVVEQQIKISKLERRGIDDAPTFRPPSPPSLPERQPVLNLSIPDSPTLHMQPQLPELIEAIPGPSSASTLSPDSHGRNEPTEAPPSPDFRGQYKRPVPVMRGPTKQQSRKNVSPMWSRIFEDGI